MNIKESRDLAERVWSMEPPANKEVALVLLEACDRVVELEHTVDTITLERDRDSSVLQHRLSDAMLQVRALQGLNATLEFQLKNIKIRGCPSNIQDDVEGGQL